MKLRFTFQALAALFLLLVTGCKMEKVQKTVGYRGPARHDPFLAAKRFLDEMGTPVELGSSFSRLPDSPSVLITPLDSFSSHGDAEIALGWVAKGGHLLVFLDDTEQWRNDYSEFSILDVLEKREHDDEELRFLELLGVRGTKHGETTGGVRVAEQEFKVALRGGIDIEKMPARVDVKAGEDAAPALISFKRMNGRVTLVASARAFRNRYIGEMDHAALLLALTGLDDRVDTITYLNNVRVSFWGMLWERAWMAIIALAVVLVVWLLKNMPRFGPAYVPQDRTTREFAEHLKLTGSFLWRCREAHALIEPMRRAVLAAAARPGHAAGGLHARIAGISGLPEARVIAAVTAAIPSDAQHFLKITEDLETIRKSL